jgi:hypothetical protein
MRWRGWCGYGSAAAEKIKLEVEAMEANIEYREINGRKFLVVDELIYDPQYEGRTVARIGEEYISFRRPIGVNGVVRDIRAYVRRVSPEWMRMEWNHDFFNLGCVPREGFRRKGKWRPDMPEQERLELVASQTGRHTRKCATARGSAASWT